MSVLLVDDPTGSQNSVTDGGLTFNGTTNTLTTTTFVGNLTGLASSATLATTATTATTATQVSVASNDGDGGETTLFPLLVETNSISDQRTIIDGGALGYNAGTGALSATSFVGAGGALTALDAGNISAGVLAVARGGTGVTTSTGSGSAFVLSTAPTFTTRILVDQVRDASGGSVELQYASTNAFRTTDETANDNTSSAEVKDGNGTFRNVGFNEMITTSLASSGSGIEISRANAGHSWRATHSSGVRTFATESADGDIPDGAIWNVRNLSTSTGTVVIQGGTGSTVRHYDGSGGRPPETVAAANPFTLARGGVATIVKIADDEYEMWGIGLTGGA